MEKESTSVEKYLNYKRSEIINKFDVSREVDRKIDDDKIQLIIKEISLINKILSMIKHDKKKIKPATLEEKRSEIVGKFSENNNKIEAVKEAFVSKNIEKHVDVKNYKDVEKYFSYNRSEIVNKFNVDYKIKEQVSREELMSIIKNVEEKNEEISKKETVKKDVKPATLEEKRSEIVGKFVKNKKKAIKNENINDSIKNVNNSKLEVFSEENLEEIEDTLQENVENISIAMIIMIVLVCSIVGTIIGYMLYKIAMNNSNVMAMIFRYFI